MTTESDFSAPVRSLARELVTAIASDSSTEPEGLPGSRLRTALSQSAQLSGTVGIVGVGLMGGSLGLALKRNGAPVTILGIGRNSEKLALAQEVGAIDAWETDVDRAAADCDIVVLCTSISHIIDQLPRVIAAARPGAVITDIGSTKTAIVTTAHGDPRFVGGHPMCGSEKTGVESAVATLYSGATWAITPSPETAAGSIDTLTSLILATGAIPLRLTPQTHDSLVAITSHVPHVLATALMRAAGTNRRTLPDLYRMSAGSFADATRVAASPAEIWRDVCITNRDSVLKALTQLRVELDAITESLEAGDGGAIESFFLEGQREKMAWQEERQR